MKNLWTKAKLACMTPMADPVNDDIWATSAAIHGQAAFNPNLLSPVGSLGAQQAMLDPLIHPGVPAGTVVPWVPDLLGEEWRHPNAVFLVGSALAGFIRGYSSRRKVMDLITYLRAPDWRAFQRHYVQQIVVGDSEYYEKLCPLINHQSRFAVFDVARCSLVERASTYAGIRQDVNINTRKHAHRSVFAQYAENPKSVSWTRARLVGSCARLIVALGFTAEYALIRLFARMGMRVCDSLNPTSPWKQANLRAPANWAYGYAGPTLENRRNPPRWWQIEDPATGDPRWALVPIVHPSNWGKDPGYVRSRKLIAAARKQIRRWP